MSRIPERKTLLKIASACLLLMLAAGGVFFVLAPYQASRVTAHLSNRYFASGEKPLVLATAAEEGAYFELGHQLRMHLDASQSYQLEVQATRGSMENLTLLKEGMADLALIQGGLAAERNVRAGDWSGGLVGEGDKLVSLANLGREYVHIVVPADSDIQRFRDLAGRRLGVGPAGGGADALARKMARFFSFGESTELIADHNPDLSEAFLDGDIEAAFTVYGLFAPAMEELLASGWYRLIPIPEADAVARYLPGAFVETLPPFLYGPDRSIPRPEDGDFKTIAVNTLLVCQSDLPDRQVFAVLEEIFSGPFLKMARLTDLNEDVAQSALHLPLHAAAESYYTRHDPISSDRFEILSFFLAGVVCLASVVHFVSGRRRVSIQTQRRDAIRPYFEAMMDYGDAIESANSPSKLTCLIHKVMATQRGAERKWLEGEFDTEDMENLYAVYSLRCDNAFHKIFDLHLQGIRGVAQIEAPAPIDVGESPWNGGRESVPAAPRDELPVEEAPRNRWNLTAETKEPEESPYRSTYEDEEDDFFTGAPLAGIDQTKKDIAAMLPSRYDSGLLYDTEASGAGAVRVRTSRTSAELQATVNKGVPDVMPQDDRDNEDVPLPAPEVTESVSEAPAPADKVIEKPRPAARAKSGEKPLPRPRRTVAAEQDDQPDQMMLF